MWYNEYGIGNGEHLTLPPDDKWDVCILIHFGKIGMRKEKATYIFTAYRLATSNILHIFFFCKKREKFESLHMWFLVL